MRESYEFLISGFGGQGILYTGKVISYAAMMEDCNVSWLPSYGPEMRGGTANCSVIVSKDEISSPLVLEPDALLAMNLPAFLKFEKDVKQGGNIFIDSSLVTAAPTRSDVNLFAVPATQVAKDEKIPKLANMIMLGKILKETGFVSYETLKAALEKNTPKKHPELLELNLKAIRLGYEY
jgi:2-oxoglutarate ferredoxin oxidoreductase subunit gamma